MNHLIKLGILSILFLKVNDCVVYKKEIYQVVQTGKADYIARPKSNYKDIILIPYSSNYHKINCKRIL